MTEQELKKEAFIAKAMSNKENFELHKSLIEKYLCIGGEMYIKDLKAFYQRQVVDNQLLLNLMEYAEKYAEKSTKNKNPSAFQNTYLAHFCAYDSYGMTLRDYFANSAMQGMLSHSKRYKPRVGSSSNWHEAIAEEAYQIADAMLKQREL